MSESTQDQQVVSASPIKNKVGSFFIPVRDIEGARDWYADLLGLPQGDCKIVNGHLCIIPMQGTAGIILDTMPMWGGQEPGGAPSIKTPSVMLLTSDLQGSYQYAKEHNLTLVSEIEHDHWFVIQDPDGNLLMVCRE